jgi:hypothetical protein
MTIAHKTPYGFPPDNHDRAQAEMMLRQREQMSIQKEAVLSRDWDKFEIADHMFWEHFRINYPYLKGGASELAQAIFLLVPLLAIYCFDLVFFRSTIDWFASQLFPAGSWTINVVILAMTLGYIVIEMSVNYQLYLSSNTLAEDDITPGNRQRYWFWLVLSLAMAIVVPAMFIATFLAGQDGQMSTFKLYLLVGLTVLAVVVHITVLFGGQPVIESKKMLVASVKHRHLDRRRSRCYQKARAQATVLRQLELDYARRVNDYNNRYGGSHHVAS